MGETKLEGTPKRVVVLDTGELDSAISPGVTPVGAVEAVEGLGLPSYLEGTGEIENVGTIEEPNLEKMATLNPDLILSSKLRHERIYDQLSQVAPTVFTETTGVTWKANFEKHAEAMVRGDEARRIMDGYRRRTEEFEKAMGDRLQETEVSVVRFLPGETRIYPRLPEGVVRRNVAGGRRAPAPARAGRGRVRPPQRERGDPQDGRRRHLRGRLRRPEGLDAEKHHLRPALAEARRPRGGDRVYEVSDDLWMLGIGPTAAVGVVDDREKHLAGS